MNESLESYHARLNSEEVVPGEWYRRNSLHYPLICYVNNIIGLYCSSTHKGIPVFVSRAFKYIKETRKEFEQEPYYQLVLEYLAEVAKFIVVLDTVDDAAKKLIPRELLHDGSA